MRSMTVLQGAIADVQVDLRFRSWDELFVSLRQCVDDGLNAWAFIIRCECYRRCPRWKWYYAQWSETQAECWKVVRRAANELLVYRGVMTYEGKFCGRVFSVVNSDYDGAPLDRLVWRFDPCPFVEPHRVTDDASQSIVRYVGDSVFSVLREEWPESKEGNGVPRVDPALRRAYLAMLAETDDPRRKKFIEEEWFRLGQEATLRGRPVQVGDLARYVEARCNGWDPGQVPYTSGPLPPGETTTAELLAINEQAASVA